MCNDDDLMNSVPLLKNKTFNLRKHKKSDFLQRKDISFSQVIQTWCEKTIWEKYRKILSFR